MRIHGEHRAINKAITLAELLKRKCPPLSQTTKLSLTAEGKSRIDMILTRRK